jgi:hypothetical protein
VPPVVNEIICKEVQKITKPQNKDMVKNIKKTEDFLNQSHYQELYEIYTDDNFAKGNITKTVKRFCEKKCD